MLCKEIAEIARRNTQNELIAAQEKSDFYFNFNCFSHRKAGKVYIFISEGNSILWFLKHVSKYLEIWDKTTYRAHVCKFSSTDGLNVKLQIPFCLLNLMLRPSRLPDVMYLYEFKIYVFNIIFFISKRYFSYFQKIFFLPKITYLGMVIIPWQNKIKYFYSVLHFPKAERGCVLCNFQTSHLNYMQISTHTKCMCWYNIT
jgi:hypothetical protein